MSRPEEEQPCRGIGDPEGAGESQSGLERRTRIRSGVKGGAGPSGTAPDRHRGLRLQFFLRVKFHEKVRDILQVHKV